MIWLIGLIIIYGLGILAYQLRNHEACKPEKEKDKSSWLTATDTPICWVCGIDEEQTWLCGYKRDDGLIRYVCTPCFDVRSTELRDKYIITRKE